MSQILLFLVVLIPSFIACEETTTNSGSNADTAEEEITDTEESAEEPVEVPAEAEQQWSEDDPEYKLASIDAGQPLDLDDPAIAKYERALDGLEKKCPEERSLLGDQSVRATQLLADEGISASTLEMLQGANKALSGKNQDLGLECAEVFASLVIIMTSGG